MLSALQKLVTLLRDDLRDCLDGKTDEPANRKTQLAEARDRVRAEYDSTKKAERTAQPFPAWREDYLTQVAVAWVLGCVFVRYLEDNALVADCWLGGPEDQKREESKARHAGFFRGNTLNDRDYLLAVFRRTAEIPAAHDLFAEGKTPLWVVGPSADAATKLVNFWHARDDEGAIPSFETADGDTRFLGDLYQDLSEDARKKYALLQTPVFVEEFILDRTLDPTCREFGFQNVRLIDPTCGSGHFLLGTFDRLMRLWQKHYHELTGHEWNPNDAAGRVLGLKDKYAGQVFGVDVNPYAVAIARFRLLIAACRWCGVVRLKDAPGWTPQVFCGDSLYYGKRWTVCTNKESGKGGGTAIDPEWDDPYHLEDVRNVTRVLSQKYHAVVGNPPYITVKDAAQNQRYRERYSTCHQKYSLGVPFTERFWDLCRAADDTAAAGFVGMITANSFMKREFGTKLIEEFFPKIDLTHVIDTSGAYIPGHDTPTVILFGRNRQPADSQVRAVQGIRGEPGTPADASKGCVWVSVVEIVDCPGKKTEFVSADDVDRATLATHPWTTGGGGATELKILLEEVAVRTLAEVAQSIGFASFTGQDEAFVFDFGTANRKAIPTELVKTFVEGDAVRDWLIDTDVAAIVPYDSNLNPIALNPNAAWAHYLWPLRRSLEAVISFGNKTRQQLGENWWTWYRWVREKYQTPLFITFGEVATHNHFVLDRGGKVFKNSAPVIKLPAESQVDDYLRITGILNSSAACFWLRQVCHNKGIRGQVAGITSELWEQFVVANSTNVGRFPLPEGACALSLNLSAYVRLIDGSIDLLR